MLSSAIYAEKRRLIQRGSPTRIGNFAQGWKSSSVENAGRNARTRRAMIQTVRPMYATMPEKIRNLKKFRGCTFLGTKTRSMSSSTYTYTNYIVELAGLVNWNDNDVREILVKHRTTCEWLRLRGTKKTRVIFVVNDDDSIEGVLQDLHRLYSVSMKYNKIIEGSGF